MDPEPLSEPVRPRGPGAAPPSPGAMGLCKCPKRKVTNLFCFEHRVNVCENCLVANHAKVPRAGKGAAGSALPRGAGSGGWPWPCPGCIGRRARGFTCVVAPALGARAPGLCPVPGAERGWCFPEPSAARGGAGGVGARTPGFPPGA